jgi:hypothetical protein
MKTSELVLPAMPIEISLWAFDCHYEFEPKTGIFRIRIPEVLTPGRGLGVMWNAYNLRESFEELKIPEDALEFLNSTAGWFRSLRHKTKAADSLSWSELRDWQEIVQQLRLREGFPLLGLQRWDKQHFYDLCHAEFAVDTGHFAERIWRISEETSNWIQGIPEGLSIQRDMYLSRDEIEQIFSAPGARIPNSRAWHYAQETLRRRRAERAKGNPECKQKLVANVTTSTILDAILATIYVDKLRGIDLQVCELKECNVTFERPLDSRKTYCSQAHAHLASVRRKRAEAKERLQNSTIQPRVIESGKPSRIKSTAS